MRKLREHLHREVEAGQRVGQLYSVHGIGCGGPAERCPVGKLTVDFHAVGIHKTGADWTFNRVAGVCDHSLSLDCVPLRVGVPAGVRAAPQQSRLDNDAAVA